MVKTRRKITALRILQVLFYALGFPLFVHLVILASSSYRDSNFVAGEILTSPVFYAAVLWAIVVLAQLLFRAICRKNRMTRTVLVALVALVVTVGPIMYCDFILKGKYNELYDAAVADGIDAPRYEQAITDYDEYIAATNDEIQQFIDVFNLETFESRNYNKGGNTDATTAGTETSDPPYNDVPYTIPVNYVEEEDAYYSPNGMYVDGFRFGYYAAKKVLTDYYTNKLAYEAEGNDIDAALLAAIRELETNPSSDWNKYKNGASESSFAMEGFKYIYSQDEYDAAYGENGTANKYFLTKERMEEILVEVLKVLKGPELEALLNNQTISSLLPLLTPFIGIDVKEALQSILGQLDPDSSVSLVDQLLVILNSSLNELGLGGLGNLIEGIDPDQPLAEMVFGLLGMPLEGELTWETLQELLASSALSVYISPSTYPVYYFIEDAGLRDYAYAKYYATVHGAKLGSVLVDTTPDADGTQYVGKITMSSSGTISPYTGESLLQLFKKWDFDEQVQKEFYSFFILRSVLVKTAAAIVFTLAAAYFFTAQIDKQYAKLALRPEGGQR